MVLIEHSFGIFSRNLTSTLDALAKIMVVPKGHGFVAPDLVICSEMRGSPVSDSLTETLKSIYVTTQYKRRSAIRHDSKVITCTFDSLIVHNFYLTPFTFTCSSVS